MNEDITDSEALRKFEERKDLFRAAALNLLAHRDEGRKCDPEAVKWAEWVVEVTCK